MSAKIAEERMKTAYVLPIQIRCHCPQTGTLGERKPVSLAPPIWRLGVPLLLASRMKGQVIKQTPQLLSILVEFQ